MKDSAVVRTVSSRSLESPHIKVSAADASSLESPLMTISTTHTPIDSSYQTLAAHSPSTPAHYRTLLSCISRLEAIPHPLLPGIIDDLKSLLPLTSAVPATRARQNTLDQEGIRDFTAFTNSVGERGGKKAGIVGDIVEGFSGLLGFK